MLKICEDCGVEWDDEEEGYLCPECNRDDAYRFDAGSYEDHHRGDR